MSFKIPLCCKLTEFSCPYSLPYPSEKECFLASLNSTNQSSNECSQFDSSISNGGLSRIISGEESTFGKIPWQAQIDDCGAVIINARQVVTAAHCVYRRNMIGQTVTAGHLLSKFIYSELAACTEQVRNITDIHVHPCYCDREYGCSANIHSIQNDIAVLTVNTPFNFNAFVQPVCLPTSFEEVPAGTRVMVSGWGTTENGDTSHLLEYTWLETVSNQECERNYSMSDLIVTADMMCAGFPGGGKGPCYGDSGGPLVSISEEGRATLLGVVSWGYGCASPYFP